MKRVLIVDDAIFMRKSLKMILERHGFEVAGEAENGLVGIQKYKQLKPDVVTLDITMPVMDGITALKEIKSIDSDAKVIIVSAMGQEPYIKEAVMNGAKSFIVKPFNDEHVLKVINTV